MAGTLAEDSVADDAAPTPKLEAELWLLLKNYLGQVLRLLKHLLLYYSRVSNCSMESMALFRNQKSNQVHFPTNFTHSHKIIVALAEFGNFVMNLSHAAAAFG